MGISVSQPSLGSPERPPADPAYSVYQDFAKAIEQGLAMMLHCNVSAGLSSVKQTTWAHLTDDFSTAPFVSRLSVSPHEGIAAIYLSPGLVFPIMEVLLGGDIASAQQLERRLTDLEEDLLHGPLRSMLRRLKECWHGVGDLAFELLPKQPGATTRQLLLAGEMLIASTIEVTLGENAKGVLILAIPTSVVRKAQPGVDASYLRTEPELAEDAEVCTVDMLALAGMEFEARLQGPLVQMRDLLKLQESQILLLDHPDGTIVVDGLLNNAPVFQGQIVSDGERRILQIENPAQ
jgi:flagellar motor switch protein FliM